MWKLLSDLVGTKWHICILTCRRLCSVCGCGEKQQLGSKIPAGPQELSQRGSMDSRLESPARLPAFQKLPELVKGASTQSGYYDYNQLLVQLLLSTSSSLIWLFSPPHLCFSSPGRCQHLFQCQLCSWCFCHGTSSVRAVPGPEVLHTPEELPLWNVPERALLQQPGSAQVRLNKRATRSQLTSNIWHIWNMRCPLKHQRVIFISSFVLLQMSQEGGGGCCICGPFSTCKYWR